jgi:DNA polymerase-3 subunit alpha
VAQIGTFGTLAAKAAIRDVGRVLNIPLARVDQLCAMVPEELKITLDKALAQSDELRKAYESDREVREWIDFARKVEGLARNVGTHAAGVVIADRPLTEYVPLQRITGKEEVVTQWEMEDVEAAGLLKMDFLGLRNLTILAKSIELIEQSTGQRIDPYRLPLDDAETFALLCRGETKGIFQLERPLAPRADQGGHAGRVHRRQARPQTGPVPASRDAGNPGRDPRRDGLSGTGDANPQSPGGD